MPIPKPDYQLSAEYRQLALDLEFPEVEVDGVSPEEARRRSEHALQLLKARENPPEWLNTFFELLDGGWPWRQAAYIAWASTPKDGRVPKTQDELARTYLGLTSDRPIATWRKKNPAILEMIAMLQSAPLWEQRADHFKALIDGAKKAGDDYKFFNHLKLSMEMRRDYIPASQISAELRKKLTGDLSELSDEELDVIERALKDRDDALSSFQSAEHEEGREEAE
jgi:hypothetical protein